MVYSLLFLSFLLLQEMHEVRYLNQIGGIFKNIKRCVLRIDKRLSLVVVSFLLINLFLTGILPVYAQEITVSKEEITIFKDDFESYAVGAFPSAGGWILVQDGKGAQYQYITDNASHSPTKSFQLWGHPEYWSIVERYFSTTANIIGFEAYVMVEDYPYGRGEVFSVLIGFRSREREGILAYVEFMANGYIQASSPREREELQRYVPRTWYKIRLVLDRKDNRFLVWINDELKASIKAARSDEIDTLILLSAWGTVRCYFDDIRIFAMQPRPPPTTTPQPTTTATMTTPSSPQTPTTTPSSTTVVHTTTTTVSTTFTAVQTTEVLRTLTTTATVTERVTELITLVTVAAALLALGIVLGYVLRGVKRYNP